MSGHNHHLRLYKTHGRPTKYQYGGTPPLVRVSSPTSPVADLPACTRRDPIIRHKDHQVLYFQLIIIHKKLFGQIFFSSCCYLRANFCAFIQLQIGISSDYSLVFMNSSSRTQHPRGLARRRLADSLRLPYRLRPSHDLLPRQLCRTRLKS
jgi:hypothetical protein